MSAYSDAILATAGLVSYWRLGDTSSPALDSKGSNNAAQTGSPTFGVTGLLPNGDLDAAVRFVAASSQRLDAPSAGTLNLGDVVSMEAWINPASFSNFQSIVSKGLNAYQIATDSTGHLRLAKSSIAFIVTSTITMSTSATYHVVATKNGATSKLYINGADVTGSVVNSTLVDNAAAFSIGSDNNVGTGIAEYFDGVIDEVALYSVALSAATVLAHYNAGITAASQGLMMMGLAM